MGSIAFTSRGGLFTIRRLLLVATQGPKRIFRATMGNVPGWIRLNAAGWQLQLNESWAAHPP